jgi:putative transcriptional regulator
VKNPPFYYLFCSMNHDFIFQTKRDFDDSCLIEVPNIEAAQIKEIRERNHVSQPVFARYSNTSKSTVQKWEIGVERPSGMALKLLSVVQKHGLHILD